MDTDLTKIDNTEQLPTIGPDEPAKAKVPIKAGFHNHAAMKAAGRAMILESLVSHKGAKLGKRGLLFKVLSGIDQDLDSDNPDLVRTAREQALKLAVLMLKDDSSKQSLGDLLQSGQNIQINFNSYFESRAKPEQPS